VLPVFDHFDLAAELAEDGFVLALRATAVHVIGFLVFGPFRPFDWRRPFGRG
jgi:hypothetical protein